MRGTFKICKYDKGAQDLVYSRVKPEPWLHIAIMLACDKSHHWRYEWAIYVWDTREVLDYGAQLVKGPELYNVDSRIMHAKLTNAIDNHQKLVGEAPRLLRTKF
jgi:hypothetical protein